MERWAATPSAEPEPAATTDAAGLARAEPEPAPATDAGGVARAVFGYEELRPGQREVIEAVVAGRHARAVMATGAGMSAIYAVAGRVLMRPTVVVSPLLALQRDQALALSGRDLSVAVVNSAQSAREHRDALRTGADYLFLAPEQLADPIVVDAVRAARPGLVAVDEAHLVAQWGADFRPDYLRLAAAIEAIGRPTVLALTATATSLVRQEIVDGLHLRDPFVLVLGFDRPNIHLSVQASFRRDVDKLEALAHDVPHAARLGQGIVYASTRRGVEGLVDNWRAMGVQAAGYHAGHSKAERASVERAFHDGTIDVVVATVAFGMGIDKPDIRWVFHADIPPSLDEYYQEIGRSGRDGRPAEAVLYYRPDDRRIPRLFAASTGPSRETIATVAGALRAHRASVAAVARDAAMPRARATAALLALRDAGALRVGARGMVTVTGDPSAAVDDAWADVQRRRAVERTRAETMEAYAEELGCRWRFLLEYFGEPAAEHCGHCDNCDRLGGTSACDGEPVPFPRGSTVVHPVFGRGEIIGYTEGRVTVGFEGAGYKRLDLGLVAERGLLTPSQ